MDKSQAMIEFLLNCEAIQNSSLYFNFVNASDEDKQFVTTTNDRALDKKFIDGSVLRRFTFTIIDYRSVAYQELAKLSISSNENVEEYLDIQGIIDWIEEQNDLENYPDFGEYCEIDEMRTTTGNPNLNGVDTSTTPALAKYSISIQIDYLDTSKVIWK